MSEQPHCAPSSGPIPGSDSTIGVQADVLGYGDDPAVEPGDTAVRVFIDRAGRPEENWDGRKTLDEWSEANSEGIEKLHNGLLPSIAWVDFVPDTPERRAKPLTRASAARDSWERSDVMDGPRGYSGEDLGSAGWPGDR